NLPVAAPERAEAAHGYRRAGHLPAPVAPVLVVQPDVTHLHLERVGVRRRVGQAAALEALDEDVGLLAVEQCLGPVRLGERVAGRARSTPVVPSRSTGAVMIAPVRSGALAISRPRTW